MQFRPFQHTVIQKALTSVENWFFSGLDEGFYRPNISLKTESGKNCFLTALQQQVLREGLPHLKQLGVLRDGLSQNGNHAEDRLTCLFAIYGRILGFTVIAAATLWSSLKAGGDFFASYQSYFFLAGLWFLLGTIWIQSLIPKNPFLITRAKTHEWSPSFVHAALDLFVITDRDFRGDWAASNFIRKRATPEHQLLQMNRHMQKEVLRLKSQVFVWEWFGLGIPAMLLLAPWVLKVIAESPG